jgi:hypothetical protein
MENSEFSYKIRVHILFLFHFFQYTEMIEEFDVRFYMIPYPVEIQAAAPTSKAYKLSYRDTIHPNRRQIFSNPFQVV